MSRSEDYSLRDVDECRNKIDDLLKEYNSTIVFDDEQECCIIHDLDNDDFAISNVKTGKPKCPK